MATSKKVSELDDAGTVTGDDLLYIVNDPLGTPTSQKVTVKEFLESNTTANVTANGSLVVVGRSVANSHTSTYTGTPADSSSVPAGFAIGTTWSDGSYIYTVTGASALKRVAISTW